MQKRVAGLIDEMARGQIHVIAFTRASQVTRLFDVGRASGRDVPAALQKTIFAAIGPIGSAALARQGITVAIIPSRTYFMKPMVSAIVAATSH